MKRSDNRFLRLLSIMMLVIMIFTGCDTLISDTGSTDAKTKAKTENTQKKKTSTSDNNNKEKTKAQGKNNDGTDLSKIQVDENGKYTSKMEVAAYIYRFKKLPSNYITKKEAQKLGWLANQGNLWKVTDKKSIGGDSFGNFEGKLPQEKGLKYFECDIDYNGGSRGPKRIIYSNKGDIYYTEDHYNTFEKLN